MIEKIDIIETSVYDANYRGLKPGALEKQLHLIVDALNEILEKLTDD